MATKETILNAVDAWISQRPGLEFANYGDLANYRQEARRITRQRRDAEALLRSCRWRDGLTADMLREGFRAYSGRLTLQEPENGEALLRYCTGQYWPTEYRAAACAVLSSALWAYTRDCCMPAARRIGDEYGRDVYPAPGNPANLISAGDWLRLHFRREFGRRIADHWFN